MTEAYAGPEWKWWLDALAGNIAPVHDRDPQCGYYRYKGGKPLAFFISGKTGALRAALDGNVATDERLNTLTDEWPYISKNPVSADAYVERIKTGKWPNDNEAVVGHNRAPVADSLEALSERIEDFAREAEKMIAAGAAPSQDVADQASDVANTLGELEGKVVTLHKAEKEPHLEAGRVVDRKWFKLRDRAADLKRRLKAVVVTPFQVRVNAEAENAKIAAIAAGVAPEALPEIRTTSGSTKRQTALRTYYRAEIEDRAKLLDSLKDHPDVVECIQKIANAAAAKQLALPGCKIIKEQRAA
jgi:hypothetical protein